MASVEVISSWPNTRAVWQALTDRSCWPAG